MAVFAVFANRWVRAEPVITVGRANGSSSAGYTAKDPALKGKRERVTTLRLLSALAAGSLLIFTVTLHQPKVVGEARADVSACYSGIHIYSQHAVCMSNATAVACELQGTDC